jgi:flavin-dependent dehydrogenase
MKLQKHYSTKLLGKHLLNLLSCSTMAEYMEETYDVVIVGAGIAGLMLGRYLSQDFSVLVIEQGAASPYKTWCTRRDYMEQNGLQKYISTKFHSYFISANNGQRVHMSDPTLCSVDCRALTAGLAKEIKDNGGAIKHHTHFTSYRKDGDSLEVHTNQTELKIRCRLLVDCAGWQSVLAHKHHIYKHRLFHNTYGQICRTSLSVNESVLLSGYPSPKPNHMFFFEALPVSKDETVTYTFTTTYRPVSPKLFRKKNHQNITDLGRVDGVDLKYGESSFPEGIIPLAAMRNRSLDNLLFFGDSGGTTPRLSGCGFSEVLRLAQPTAEHLGHCLTTNQLKARNLVMRPSQLDKLNAAVQAVFGNFMAVISLQDFQHMVYIMLTSFGSEIANGLLFNRLTREQCRIACFTVLKKRECRNIILRKLPRILMARPGIISDLWRIVVLL